jgi:hypothetical protein
LRAQESPVRALVLTDEPAPDGRGRSHPINDPPFGGEGTPLDPGALLTPVPGKRARVSVISFVGLPSDA